MKLRFYLKSLTLPFLSVALQMALSCCLTYSSQSSSTFGGEQQTGFAAVSYKDGKIYSKPDDWQLITESGRRHVACRISLGPLQWPLAASNNSVDTCQTLVAGALLIEVSSALGVDKIINILSPTLVDLVKTFFPKKPP